MADRDRRAHDHAAARRHQPEARARRSTPFPGISAKVVDDEGNELADDSTGLLVLTEPWPSMLRTIWGDDDRYVDTYWSRFGKNVYFAGDGAKKDADGNIWLLGRVDDVMNVSGHRISTTEVESTLVGHPAVAEAAVVGASDPTTGQGIVAFVILRESGTDSGDELVQTLRNHVAKDIGPIAKPRQIMVVQELPKTRSGKIMRRLLRDIAENRELGDVTTLTDSSVMNMIKDKLPVRPVRGLTEDRRVPGTGTRRSLGGRGGARPAVVGHDSP